MILGHKYLIALSAYCLGIAIFTKWIFPATFSGDFNKYGWIGSFIAPFAFPIIFSLALFIITLILFQKRKRRLVYILELVYLTSALFIGLVLSYGLLFLGFFVELLPFYLIPVLVVKE